MPETDSPGVRLSEAIAEVRRELSTAIAQGQKSDVAFRAGPIELEFDVAFDSTTGANGGVHVWVVSLSGSHEVHRTVSNHLKITLTPVDRQGKDRLIGSTGSE